MAHTPDELQQLLARASGLPYGSGQISLVEQVIAHADAGGHDELAFEARMLATSAYFYGAEPAKAFVTFSRCLSEFDSDPRPYHQSHVHHLLWHFKWMVGALLRFPEIPLARTQAVLDDMERRYRAGGHSLHTIYAYRHAVARHVGDQAAAAQLYEQWCAAPPDGLSDCRACDPSAKVSYLVDRGRDEEAVALAEPVVAGEVHCQEQPQAILTRLMVPYARTGRHDEAVAAHRRAYRAYRGNRGEFGEIAYHVAFCGRTGNEVRGLELVRRHLGWLGNSPSPMATMDFAAAAALVLRRLAIAGQGGLAVPRPGGHETEVAALADELAELAAGLAGQFDERNGTTFQSGRIAAMMAAEPLADQLPLSPTSRRGAVRSGPPAAPPPPAPAIPDELSPAELLKHAEQRSMLEDGPGVEAALRAFDERFTDVDLDPHTRALRLDWVGMQRLVADDSSGAEDCFRRAATELAAAGDELHAQSTLGRLGWLLCQRGAVDEGRPLVEASAAYMAAHGEATRRASALLRLAEVLQLLGRGEAALDRLDEAMTHASEAGRPHLAGRVALQRAGQLAELGHPEAVAAAAQARELFAPVGGDGYAQACLFYAGQLDNPAQKLPVVQEAVRAAGPELAPGARLALGSVLAELDRDAEAVEEYLESVALATEADDEPLAAQARLGLASAYLHSGQPLAAAEAGEEALVGLAGPGEELAAQRDECRELLVYIYGEVGEETAALAQLDELVASYGRVPDRGADRGRLHEFAGQLLSSADRDVEAAARFETAASEYATAGEPLAELRARRQAMLSSFHVNPTAARTVLAELDARAAALGDEPAQQWERAMVGYDGALLLAEDDQPEEAVARLEPLAARFRAIEAFEEAFLAELLRGDILLRSGRAEPALPVLREVTEGLPREHPRLEYAAWLLSVALEETGQPRAAAKVRRRYGIEEPD